MRARWLAVVAAAALTAVAWGLVRSGPSGRRRAYVTVGAVPGDWVLVAGAAVTLALAAAAALAMHRARREARRLEEVRAEQQAAADDGRWRLLGRLDHELKNPLMAMRAASANLAAGDAAEGAAEQATGLRTIEEQVVRLSRLTSDLRKIAEVERHPLDKQVVDVAEIVEEAVDLVREQPAAAPRRWGVDLPRAPWPLPKIEADADLLTLALVNLLDNAVKFTAEGDSVEVRAREAAPWVVVEVADTGPGIAAEDLPNVWQELYRGARTRAVAGSGLGLALVRAIVERHGGEVAVTSRIGQGTAVTVRLPAS